MTKSDFIDAVATRSGLSKKDAGAALDAVLDSVKDALQKGDERRLHRFRQVQRAGPQGAHRGEPAQPGQKVTIPASKVPKFSAGSQLKAAVKQ